MNARGLGTGLIALGLLVSASASRSARAEHAAANVDDVPTVSFDMGGSLFQPNLGGTMFSTLDTWSGKYNTYHATGAALGIAHPMGAAMNVNLHFFPFHFRSIGFITTFDLGTFTGNMTPATTPFGLVDSTNTTYWSWVAGPEGQIRFGDILFRAAVLGGGRYTSIGDYSATEWRVAARAEVDWITGGSRRKDGGAFTLGVFGAGDLVPTLGWNVGAMLSFSFL
jgi:hypothetical protein